MNRVTLVILICFGAIAVSLTYWSVFGQSLLARNDNPRLVENDLAIRRGVIEDRNGKTLVESIQTGISLSGEPIYKRRYPYLQAVSATGYYNYDHGSSGVEAAFDATLRGTDRPTANEAVLESLLHQPSVGSDLRLTVDLNLQTILSNAYAGKRGAAIVIDVPSGAVLGIVSAPGFDPNLLDQDKTFDHLYTDPNSPLVNRAIQRLYAPGAALQTPILAAALNDKLPLTTRFPGVTASITIGGQPLTCAATTTLTLQQAYALACPSVMVDVAMNRPDKVQDMIAAFGLLRSPTLDHLDVAIPAPNVALTALTDPARLQLQAAGQGDLLVTPLQMALVAATIANHGNQITPYLVSATRIPGGDWQVRQPPTLPDAVITQDVADNIKTAMLSAVTDGSAQAAAQSDGTAKPPILPIYGHAGLSYTGSEGNTWFIGFVDAGANRSIAIAVIVEGTTDPAIAAKIGGDGLRAASQIGQ